MSWVANEMLTHLRRGAPADAIQTLVWAMRERVFERWYKIDSATALTTKELGTDSSTSERYEPTNYHVLRKALKRIRPERRRQEVLLDVGCGKGRVLRVAATYPYKRLVGIEIAQSLIDDARRNLANLQSAKCNEIELVTTDAGIFNVPDDVSAIFFYNPFKVDVMDMFMTRVQESLGRNPRQLRIVFVNPWSFHVDRYSWIREMDAFSCFYPGMAGGMKVGLYSTGQ